MLCLTVLAGASVACSRDQPSDADAPPPNHSGEASAAAASASDSLAATDPAAPLTPPATTSAAAAGPQGTSSPALIAHPGNVQAGLASTRPLIAVTNPREHDARALAEGKALFVSYNCADCHGSEGSGAVGPSLQDGRWHFGGSSGEVYESIAEGRPNGMPSWGGRIADSQIWALVTYVRSLSAGKDVTTERFEGSTVQRSGH